MHAPFTVRYWGAWGQARGRMRSFLTTSSLISHLIRNPQRNRTMKRHQKQKHEVQKITQLLNEAEVAIFSKNARQSNEKLRKVHSRIIVQ